MVKRLLCAGCAAVLLAASLAGCGSTASPSASASSAASASADPAMAGWEKYTASWYDVFDTVTTVIGYASSEEEWDRQMDALQKRVLPGPGHLRRLGGAVGPEIGLVSVVAQDLAEGRAPAAGAQYNGFQRYSSPSN